MAYILYFGELFYTFITYKRLCRIVYCTSHLKEALSPYPGARMDVMGKAVQRAFQAASDAAAPADGLGRAALDAAALADGLGRAASDAAALADDLGQAALDAAALAGDLGQAAFDVAALAGGPHLIGYFPSKRNPDASPFVPPSDHCLYNLLILGIHIQLD